MSHLYPSKEALQGTIYSPMSARRSPAPGPTRYQARPELYGAWSVVDDAKDKAQKLSAEATKGIEKTSSKVQAQTGGIELFSGRYYAACTVGGLLACVSLDTNHFCGCLPA